MKRVLYNALEINETVSIVEDQTVEEMNLNTPKSEKVKNFKFFHVYIIIIFHSVNFNIG